MATKLKEVDADIDRDDDEATEREERILEQARALIHSLSRKADECVRAKNQIEQRWVEELRLYRGQYDKDTEATLDEEKRSKAFVKLTRHKTNGWSARLFDLLFPTDERNWGIQPTPLPTLSRKAKEAVEAIKRSVDDANLAEAQGNPQASAMLLEQANAFTQKVSATKQEIEEAKKRCEAMEKTIEDQLIEAKYAAQCRDVIEDGCKIGTGILKGPMTSQKLRREWRKEKVLGGRWALSAIPDPMPDFRRVDPWHFFPESSARNIDDAEYTFERHLPTKKDLRRMALKLGFSKAAVRRLIEEGAPNAPENIDNLTLLRQMEGDEAAIKDRYVMWEYHGPLECEDVALLLHAAGEEEAAREYEEEKDPLQEYRVIVHFCGNELLKIAADYPLDSGDSLYSVFNFEKSETSIWGYGVPYLMSDSQHSINGAWRMMHDNAALSVGPQIIIDKSAISPQNPGDWNLKPLKVWLRSSTAVPSKVPPFEAINIPNNQQQLAGIIEIAKVFIDEETSLPTIAQGEQGAASQTLGGMSILFNSANVVFRRVVKTWDDDVTTPTLRRAYDWNMQFNPDESIKGDMQVDARGTSVLLVREIQSQNLLNIVTNWSVHQVLGSYVKIRPAMEKALQTMMVPADDVLLTEEEHDQEMARQAEVARQNPPPPSAEEIRYKIAQEGNETKRELAALEAETKRTVAELAYDGIMAQLADKTGLTQRQLELKYGIDKEKIASAERMKAVDIAVEDRRAKEAKAEGRDTVEARGQGVG